MRKEPVLLAGLDLALSITLRCETARRPMKEVLLRHSSIWHLELESK